MKGKEFLESKWIKKGNTEEGSKEVSIKYENWKSKVKNIGLIEKAGQLWNYFISDKTTIADKGIVIGALLYLIAPIDLIPDFIPIAGWLDDIGIATFALQHLNTKLSELALAEEISGTEQRIIESSSPDIYRDNYEERFEIKTKNLSYNLPELKEIAIKLDAKELASSIENVQDNLCSDFYQIVFTGRYGTGKTSIINAILGENYFAATSTPTTKAITYIGSGKSQSLFTEDPEGVITYHDSLEILKEKENKDINNAKRIKVTLPEATLVDNNTYIVDSPGIEDPNIEISKLVYEVIPESDAIVLVCDFYSLSKKEVEFLKNMLMQDKKRKLFIVLNKIDAKSEQEINDKLIEIKKTLEKEIGINDSNIFTLSAKSVLENETKENLEFNEFKKALFKFIREDKETEKKRTVSGKSTLLKEELKKYCEVKIELSKLSKEKRGEALVKIKAKEDSLYQLFDKEKNKLERKVDMHEDVFNANMITFKENLLNKLFRTIDGAKLSELKNLEINSLIRNSISKWLEEQLIAINNDMKIQTNELAFEMKMKIMQSEIPINVSHDNWLDDNKGLILPGIIVLSFPIMGMFSWLYLAIGGMLGRGVVENLLGGISEKVGANKIRIKFKEEISPIYNKLWVDIREQKETYFINLKQNIFKALEESFKESISSLNQPLGTIYNKNEEQELQNLFKKLQ